MFSQTLRLFSSEARLRDRINRDLDLAARLDWNADAKQQLQDSIARRVERLARQDKVSWDGAGVGTIVALSVIAAAMIVPALKWQGWWTWPLIILGGISAVFALAGFFIERGNARAATKERGQASVK